jgi:hypothetical protein
MRSRRQTDTFLCADVGVRARPQHQTAHLGRKRGWKLVIEAGGSAHRQGIGAALAHHPHRQDHQDRYPSPLHPDKVLKRSKSLIFLAEKKYSRQGSRFGNPGPAHRVLC